ncbi:YbdD/YjiX family protein [Bifidobacterium pseudolongum subsp. pseudolongum]|nr:YbdD/YjiX family protein [Bifidobacterium pseudolongum]UNP90825.1 YbdD/YjiX family protein [Bifidobacterium pseudolongum subsp. pseudolongum]WCA41467.1 YbdD/YjiX family protein [Bifidobacterium pseudolongum subsp. pseudolongum]
MREVSGEARYEHYVERFTREHPGEEPLSERAYLKAREEHERLHPNTGCCC